jgi:putative membrane protein insertion efficiency factor
MFRLLIRAYQIFVSPVLTYIVGPGCGCRFEPTCSHYLLEAVETHGALRGGWLGLKRLARCHPWGGAGPDPVPPAPCSCRAPLRNGENVLVKH